MNGDGNLDVVSNTFAAISVLPGNGDGTFGPAIISGVGAGTGETVRVRDFDGDGTLDVVTATWTGNNDDAQSVIHLNRGNGDGTLEWVQSFAIGANHPHGDAADLNGDGLPDLAITGTAGTHTGPGGMFVAINVGGVFAAPAHYDAEQVSLALGDLNGDARPEAVLTNASPAGVVQVWTNSGDGTFHPNPLELAAPDSPYEAELANLVGSPRLDLAVLGSAINPSRLVLYVSLPGPTTLELLDRPERPLAHPGLDLPADRLWLRGSRRLFRHSSRASSVMRSMAAWSRAVGSRSSSAAVRCASVERRRAVRAARSDRRW